ncbi:MAG: hypothetical protein J0L89_01410 [Xanthomonadales bacterium]|nr:hypothetical protein [Xanthomonadales bacterium]
MSRMTLPTRRLPRERGHPLPVLAAALLAALACLAPAGQADAGELVSGGGVITGRPTHDMRITLWRIRPDGQARRVYYTLKAGRARSGRTPTRSGP